MNVKMMSSMEFYGKNAFLYCEKAVDIANKIKKFSVYMSN